MDVKKTGVTPLERSAGEWIMCRIRSRKGAGPQSSARSKPRLSRWMLTADGTEYGFCRVIRETPSSRLLSCVEKVGEPGNAVIRGVLSVVCFYGVSICSVE